MYAYDDMTCTAVDLENDLDCGVRGDVLLSLLKNAGPKFSVTKVEDELQIKDGRGIMRLPTLSSKHFLYEDPLMPNPKGGTGPDKIKIEVKVGKPFFDALALSIENCLADAYKPELSGVTMVVGDEISLYAFDFASLLVHNLPVTDLKGKGPTTSILSKSCSSRASQIFDDLGNPEQQVVLKIGDRHVRFEYEGAGVTMVSRVIAEKPLDYAAELKAFPLNVEPFEIPFTLSRSLERCVALLGKELTGVLTMHLSEHGILVTCKGPYGEATLPHKAPVMPERKIDFNPRILLRCLPVAQTMSFTTKHNGQSIHFFNDYMHFIGGRYPE